MNLIFRLLKTLLLYLLRPTRRGILEESVVRFRVWPNDLDTNLHMNNGRYLTLMDLGRLDLLLRNGSVRHRAREQMVSGAGGNADPVPEAVEPVPEIRDPHPHRNAGTPNGSSWSKSSCGTGNWPCRLI